MFWRLSEDLINKKNYYEVNKLLDFIFNDIEIVSTKDGKEINLSKIEKEKAFDGLDISSTLIRELLLEGRVSKANEFLGTEYSIGGIVKTGNRIGKKLLGFPTLNIFPPKHKILPKFGVYATRVKLNSTGEIFDSITNVGNNPTVKDDLKNHTTRIETHIFDFDRDIYEESIEVYFVEYIRAEEKFESLEDLKLQMEEDKNEARRILCT